jgi:beta-glucanase (GH16 family)
MMSNFTRGVHRPRWHEGTVELQNRNPLDESTYRYARHSLCDGHSHLLDFGRLSRNGRHRGWYRRKYGCVKKNVIFFDDFLGTSIDTAKWTVFDRLSDQDNHELNCVVPENVSVKDGLLEGVSKYEDHRCGDSLEWPKTMHYTSWHIQQATKPFLYGTIEVRAKVPGGVGTWPVIWMLGFEWQASQPYTASTPEHQGPNAGWCEIDIAEFWRGGRREVNTTVHYNKPGGLHIQKLSFDASTQFAVYRLEWTQGALVWSVDAEDGNGFQKLYSGRGSRRVPNVPM